MKFNRQFSIDGREIGQDCPVYIIAEAGVAHFGSIDKAFKLVDLARQSGADAVKFQIFQVDELIAAESKEWRERLATRCLPHEDFYKIQSYCREQGITFFATAHDEASLEFLSKLDVPAYKIGSGEVDNWPFLAKVASLGKPVIFSTGMYTLAKVEEALNAIAETGNKDIALLHCITNYPAPADEINLRSIAELHKRFEVITGYSDHTRGIHFPLAAVALGAKIIEKHITLDYNIPNAQDWKVSCSWDDLPQLVEQAREIEKGLGTGAIGVSNTEMDNLAWARKSLVSAVDLKKGDILSTDKIICKRPGTGIAPSQLHSVIGKKINKHLAADTVIHWQDLE
ncbi:MAG: N-acetylneuraminate synthase family protein [Desulfobulbaceae bacterium]|nr:N-acetylneuraminate synthase family protein [Desulfobulbaceae bacterium]